MTTRPTGAGTQDEIVAVLASVLLLEPEQVDRSLPFVDIGLDSILAVEFVTALRAGFSGDISLDTLYAHPSVTELAEHLDRTATRVP
ncbi:acyl carrier protein [Saccharothrix algeriensis]|uniref:Acyl carrier protein n=1 Tax=Saccharothrix algeriensis TaxID=173560 RepID=A0A8T8HZM5_9PSEU|nr:acyl carrier protein [Saccharothrix algeriensis]MBM7809851.1 acyl carrier protein [Saccharothrix algeriensis]QTR04113.1 acyl carrier protein [Saccharothrix algeriensis]